jgi:two-component system chemotaxis response regulator CheB
MSPRHLELLKPLSSGKEQYLLSDGVLWAAKCSNHSAAIWLHASELAPGDFEKALETLERTVGNAESIEGFKLVGCARLIAQIDQWCRQKGLSVLNQAVRNGVFEAKFSSKDCKILVARKLKVLIVDDSRTIRTLFQKLLSADPGLEVVGATDRPSSALQLMSELKPDVITLDLEMPEQDGVSFLKEFLPKFPIPTVMVSAISREEGPRILEALEAGAVDYVQKPSARELAELAPLLIEKVKAAGGARVARAFVHSPLRSIRRAGGLDPSKLIAIGSSTGGTEALRMVLTQLPAEIPPIVITQHIPAIFSKAFAERMNSLCPFQVCEATDGMEVLPGNVYIAPGGKQMRIHGRKTGRIYIEVNDSPPVNRHKPSVDYLFDSVAEVCGTKSIGVILTGMGSDGAEGLLRMKRAGARTIAQNEATCAVFGMPREAIALGAADEILDIEAISEKLIQWLSHRRSAA